MRSRLLEIGQGSWVDRSTFLAGRCPLRLTLRVVRFSGAQHEPVLEFAMQRDMLTSRDTTSLKRSVRQLY